MPRWFDRLRLRARQIAVFRGGSVVFVNFTTTGPDGTLVRLRLRR